MNGTISNSKLHGQFLYSIHFKTFTYLGNQKSRKYHNTVYTTFKRNTIIPSAFPYLYKAVPFKLRFMDSRTPPPSYPPLKIVLLPEHFPTNWVLDSPGLSIYSVGPSNAGTNVIKSEIKSTNLNVLGYSWALLAADYNPKKPERPTSAPCNWGIKLEFQSWEAPRGALHSGT